MLPQTLEEKLLPWAADSAGKRLIVARPVMKRKALPDGVQIERRKISGERIVVKNRRYYANTRLYNALWPAAGLNEVAHHKLVCVLSGRMAYQINDYLLHAGAGYFLFLPPGTPHPDGSAPHLQNNRGWCELLNIVLHRGAIQCWVCRSEESRHSSDLAGNYLLRNERAARLFRLLAEEAVEDNGDGQTVCENLLVAFLTVLRRELVAGRYLHPGLNTIHEAPRRAPDDFATALREYVQAHLHEPLTLESVARQMYLSRSQFARQVKRATGDTFGELLTHCRIEEAKALLRDSEWTASAIAGFVGFKSVTYFHDLFVRRVGSTPGNFRKAVRRKVERPPRIS